MAVINRIAGFAEQMAGWRQHLHMHPELGLDCHRTAAFVVDQLRAFGVDEIHEGIAQTGVVGIIEGKGDSPVTLGLRADMDALPMTEATGKPWASTVPGRMHACGHDGHTAMLLGAARYLAETRSFAGRVAVIFQPAEETIGGGRMMVEEGMMERFGITEVYGIHTSPDMPEGVFQTCPGPIMASVDDFTITLTGKGGHAAYPDLCRDPIQAGLAIGQALNTIVSHNRGGARPLIVSLTQFHAGTAYNIVPETATLTGTVRTLDADMRDVVEARIHEIVAGQAAALGVEAVLDYQRNYPVTVNHPGETDRAVRVARTIVGDAAVMDDMPPELGAEDFSYMLEARPGAFLFLGQGLGPSAHHPAFDFNDAVAPVGASFFARLVETRQPVG